MQQRTWREIEQAMERRFENERVEIRCSEEAVAIRVKDACIELRKDQQADVDVWMVLLNVLRGDDGKKLITLQATADAFGYEHRQDVDNRMRRYRAAGDSVAGVLAPWIRRPWVLTPEVKAAIEAVAVQDVRAGAEEIRKKLVAQGTVKREDAISLKSIYDALAQGDLNKLRIQLRRQLEDGSIQYKEEHLIARLFELVQSQQKLLEQNELVKPATVLSPQELRAMIPSSASLDTPEETSGAQTAFRYPLRQETIQGFLFGTKNKDAPQSAPRCPQCDTAETTKKTSKKTTVRCGAMKRKVRVEKRRCKNEACERKVFSLSPQAEMFWLEMSITVLILYAYCRTSFGRIAFFYHFNKKTAYDLFCTFGRACALGMLEVCGPGLRFSGVLVIDEKWVKIPKHFKAKGLDQKFAFAYIAVDPHTMDLVHYDIFESNDHNSTKLFLLQLRATGYVPLIIITDGLAAYASAIPEVFPRAIHHLCIRHFLRNQADTLREIFGKHYKSISKVAELYKSLCRIFACKDPRTAHKRFQAVMARRDEFVSLHPDCAKVFDALARDFPKLVNAIGSSHIPKTTNAAELVIRQFAMHYKTMAGFETLQGARTQLKLFALVYRFTPFTDKARKAWRGLCPLEIAGYAVQNLPIYKMLRTPLAENVVQLATQSDSHLGADAA